jgi:hypothetical protein
VYGDKDYLYDIWDKKFKKYEALIVNCYADKDNLLWYKSEEKVINYSIDYEKEAQKKKGRKMEVVEYTSSDEDEEIN